MRFVAPDWLSTYPRTGLFIHLGLGRLEVGTVVARDATGLVAQLGERRTEDAEAAGSSPASPTINSHWRGLRSELVQSRYSCLRSVDQRVELFSE